MSLQLIADLGECRQRLAELRGRPNYLALTCAILRREGDDGTIPDDSLQFSPVSKGLPYYSRRFMSCGENFALLFRPTEAGSRADQIPKSLAPVEAITDEIQRLVHSLPRTVCDRLRLPEIENWWRIVFHLGWHFPRLFFRPTRSRLLSSDGASCAPIGETYVQLYGTGKQSDLWPGLIYSDLEHDLCTCSEAAVNVVIEALERSAQTGPSALTGAQGLSSDQRRTFDRLRSEFLAGVWKPPHLTCKLLKLADSFATPPAMRWANLQQGRGQNRLLKLSALNEMQEIAQLYGLALEEYCEVAERAGKALPAFVPDCPILFDDVQRGLSGPRPVMNRGPLERWIGFVFATLQQHGHESLSVRWSEEIGPFAHGCVTLAQDFFAASALAIDLACLAAAAPESPVTDPVKTPDVQSSPSGSNEDERETTHPDGVAGRWLWWKGKRHNIPQGVVSRLIAYMWGKEAASYDSLDRTVFDGKVSANSIRARASEVNGLLKRIGIPWRLSADSPNRLLTKMAAD